MFIFKLLNIMMDKKKVIMIKQGARLGKVWAKKSHVSQKIVLYLKGITVHTENYIQRSRSQLLKDKRHKQFSTP